MKIYTKTGDKGTTSLVYGERVQKNDIRVEAYGTCDEANSMIGLGVSLLPMNEDENIADVRNKLHRVQTILFHVGAELSTPSNREVKWKLEEKHIKEMESTIDDMDSKLPTLNNFILPGGHPSGAAFHTARTIIRRAERCAVAIENVNPLVLSYLNRLSDFLFVLARYVNYQLGAAEFNLHEEKKC